MRITETELCTLDIEWYGVDRRGNIAVFCSAGAANVPEFVCESMERVDMLIDFFDKLPRKSECGILFVPPKKNPLPKQIAEEYAGKGLFYFDSDDMTGKSKNTASLREYYTKNAYPLSPLKLEELPRDIAAILENQRLDVEDFSRAERIEVAQGDVKHEPIEFTDEKGNCYFVP